MPDGGWTLEQFMQSSCLSVARIQNRIPSRSRCWHSRVNTHARHQISYLRQRGTCRVISSKNYHQPTEITGWTRSVHRNCSIWLESKKKKRERKRPLVHWPCSYKRMRVPTLDDTLGVEGESEGCQILLVGMGVIWLSPGWGGKDSPTWSCGAERQWPQGNLVAESRLYCP